MDLADVSLVVLAEELRDGRILSTDQRDFSTYRWKNKRTGEVLRVPNGIDPGWQSNPGMTRERNVQQMLAGKDYNQLLQMADNAARERGTTVEQMAQQLGLPFRR